MEPIISLQLGAKPPISVPYQFGGDITLDVPDLLTSDVDDLQTPSINLLILV
jgi:hypothetical protein